jgi:uncharacterized protein (TIGR02266 family)
MFVKRKQSGARASEQRHHTRVAVEAEVTIDSEHNFYYGLSENLSEGGLFVSTYQPEELGRELELTFTLPGTPDPLRVRARVQWVREYSPQNCEVPSGIGLQFIDPPQSLINAVRTFIQKREPGFYE